MKLDSAQRSAEQLQEQLDIPTFKYGLSLRLSTRNLELDDANDLETSMEWSGDVTIATVDEASYEDKLLELYEHDVHKLTAHHVATLDSVHVIHVHDDAAVRVNHHLHGSGAAHVIVIADDGATCHIIEHVQGQGSYASLGVEAYAGDRGQITYESLHDTDAWQYTVKRGRAHRDASIDWFTAALGGMVDKTEVSTELLGEGGTTTNSGLYHGTGRQRFDIYNQSSHEAPHTRSDMTNKGVVTDRSKGIYRGLVDIGETAHDSQGYQTEDALILSDDAEADAVPNLEIANNDVQCSHGATIGRVDDEQLYYMRTRGVTREQARRAIVKGFLYDITASVEDKELRETVEQRVEDRL